MKQYISTLLTFLFVLPVLSAQMPLYIQFEPTCVNQLEYQFTYTNQNLLMYSIAKGENELYFFVISNKEPVLTAQSPVGTVTCQSDEINATVIENINAGGRLAYIVFKAQNGFLSFPVESAGYIARSGTYFAFRTPNYDFVMDTASINYARNLSRPGVASPVYLTGRRSQDCLQLYAFRLEPVQPEAPRADVEVIPGIGIISDRTGRNGSEMEQNVYRLLRINGISLDDYIYAACNNPKNQDGTSSSFITSLPPTANPNDAFNVQNPFVEPDKEGYYTQPPSQSGNTQLVNCPIPPGQGYHIVQPGDSLGGIARRYNVDKKALMQWNNLKNANQIKVCDRIWVVPQTVPGTASPGATGYHVVQKGETLFSIARKYNTTVANIRHWNNLKNDEIQAGQQLAVSASQTSKPATIGNQAAPPYTAPPNTPAVTGLPPSAASGRLTYKVQGNESLSSIAWRFGYTVPYLRHINRANKNLPVGNDDKLPEGLVLIVSDSKSAREDLASFIAPAPALAQSSPAGLAGQKNLSDSPVQPFAPPATNPANFEFVGEYIVQNGDTLASIAQKYGLAPEKLAVANNLLPGQQPIPRSILKIPK
ncbi:MAG: hypothetical protein OHK0019_18720 [Saprospiraceae bacterium]